MWDGFNKRKFPRLNLQCEILIHSQKGSPVKAITENVGVGGVCVLLDASLERFSECRVKLDLGGSYKSIETSGKIVWTIPTSTPTDKKKKYDTGIEFVEIKPDDQKNLHAFLEAHLPKGFQEIPT